MITNEPHIFHENETNTCQALLHQASIFTVLVHVSILGFLTVLDTLYSINRGVSPMYYSLSD